MISRRGAGADIDESEVHFMIFPVPGVRSGREITARETV